MASGSKPRASWPDPSKRPSRDEYATWLSAIHDVDLGRERGRYEASVDRIVAAAATGAFWTDLQSQRIDLGAAYLATTGFKLFAFAEDAAPTGKSWDSFSLKTFRRNVLDNDRFPDSPARGWLLPHNWLHDITDIVRTVLVVKYLDGVKFLTEAMEQIAEFSGVDFRSDLQARDTGYYAAHTSTTFEVALPNDDWTLESRTLRMEVQITTQLQEVMARLTHKQYERRRLLPASASQNWQWNHSSDDFQPNYLGHLLHYAEGMIMEVRDRDTTS